jgi:protein CpxP
MQTSKISLTAALLAGAFAFGSAAWAQSPPATPSTATGPQVHHAKRANPEDTIDNRIKDLHTRLKITADQETQWSAVAQAMHDSADAWGELIKQRQGNTTAMTAVDDLKSYAQIEQTRADGTKKVEAAFEPLYAAMSDDQKKNADAVFSNSEGRKASK